MHDRCFVFWACPCCLRSQLDELFVSFGMERCKRALGCCK